MIELIRDTKYQKLTDVVHSMGFKTSGYHTLNEFKVYANFTFWQRLFTNKYFMEINVFSENDLLIEVFGPERALQEAEKVIERINQEFPDTRIRATQKTEWLISDYD